MTFIGHPSIKRISEDEGLESITIRSDVAARYLFLNEALLNTFNVIKPEDREQWSIGLKETLLKDKIVDETQYLDSWLAKLKGEVGNGRQGKVTSSSSSSSSERLDNEIKYLDESIRKLKEEFLNPDDEGIRKENNLIFKEYTKKFDRIVYEVRENVKRDDGDDDDDGEDGEEKGEDNSTNDEEDDNDSDEYTGSAYYRLPKRIKYEGVKYARGVYKRRRRENRESEVVNGEGKQGNDEEGDGEEGDGEEGDGENNAGEDEGDDGEEGDDYAEDEEGKNDANYEFEEGETDGDGSEEPPQNDSTQIELSTASVPSSLPPSLDFTNQLR